MFTVSLRDCHQFHVQHVPFKNSKIKDRNFAVLDSIHVCVKFSLLELFLASDIAARWFHFKHLADAAKFDYSPLSKEIHSVKMCYGADDARIS